MIDNKQELSEYQAEYSKLILTDTGNETLLWNQKFTCSS